jgi:atypical dual specificity phosphatase
MDAPTMEQLEQAVESIERSGRAGMAVAVHCTAGHGRTGTILAAYFVNRGMSAVEAIEHVRKLRPGSIETTEQEYIVKEYASTRF